MKERNSIHMKQYSRLLAMLLVLLMTVSLFVACKNKDNKNDSEKTERETERETEAETEPELSEKEIDQLKAEMSQSILEALGNVEQTIGICKCIAVKFLELILIGIGIKRVIISTRSVVVTSYHRIGNDAVKLEDTACGVRPLGSPTVFCYVSETENKLYFFILGVIGYPAV